MVDILTFLANFGFLYLISVQFLTFLTNHANVSCLLAFRTTGEMVFHQKQTFLNKLVERIIVYFIQIVKTEQIPFKDQMLVLAQKIIEKRYTAYQVIHDLKSFLLDHELVQFRNSFNEVMIERYFQNWFIKHFIDLVCRLETDFISFKVERLYCFVVDQIFIDAHALETMPFSRMITEPSIIVDDVESFGNRMLTAETFVILFFNLLFYIRITE